MMTAKNIRELLRNRYITGAIAAAGLLLVLISSMIPDKRKHEDISADPGLSAVSENYRKDTEHQLEEFLSSIDGAGKVRVYLKTSGSERKVYVSEGRSSESEDRKEVEEKYVMVSEGGSRKALLGSVEEPEITGAVVVCTGGDSPVVQERIYRSLGALLSLSSGSIYVTKMG